MKKKDNKPIRKKREVQQSNDEHIDQDFPGFPHPPAKKDTIIHNGSANAFSGTEYDGGDEAAAGRAREDDNDSKY